jgi:hypothetical protein
VVILAGFVVTGCLNGAAKENMDQYIKVKFDTKVEIRDDKLLIYYRVDNGLSEPIYLINRVFRWTSSGFSIDPNLVYTEIIGDRLQLTKAYINVPEDIDVEAPEVPFLTEIAASDRFEENISQPLPLEPYHPYAQVKPSEVVRTFEQVQLVVGWLPSSKVSAQTVNRPEGLTLLSVNYTEVAREQKLLLSTLNVKLPTRIQERK